MVLVGLAIEFSELHAARVGAGLVLDQQGVPAQVACRGARHLTPQCHLGPSIDDVGRDVDRARHVTAHLLEPCSSTGRLINESNFPGRRPPASAAMSTEGLAVGSLAAFVPAM